MEGFPYVADRAALTEAQALILAFGSAAAGEAVARADRSRDLGNHIHFCRWRQIERLIDWLSTDRANGTLH